MANPGETERTKLNRLSYKASHSTEDLYSILDANLVAHVGIIFEGRPLVIPMAYGRVANTLYLHGSSGSRLMRALEQEPAVCVSITELRALKVARSTFNSGMHYRSVVIFGEARLVSDDEKDQALNALSDAMIPGRVSEVRQSKKKELAATIIVAVQLDETSVKISVNEVDDDEDDLNQGVWAGIVPLKQGWDQAIPADDEAAGLPVPASVQRLIGG
ncbi:pyridoxamine 5'-phosphate oxidase family protein [Aquiluna borgnonia]|uniref:Pyridoxamine 5'-phosphate oxidase family protein n=1 Tax=Aquiluna borgnonia TaxID=2499157 RepID=A0A7D4Q487_9MICO|nr:pyridoxamine 5'-phosphate oxidase family protein [Aquiluna borgnonia]QKJ24863.1 pyridoxamine 5'-phosphate oxidase family protein [Aquiluna borgnonia]